MLKCFIKNNDHLLVFKQKYIDEINNNVYSTTTTATTTNVPNKRRKYVKRSFPQPTILTRRTKRILDDILSTTTATKNQDDNNNEDESVLTKDDHLSLMIPNNETITTTIEKVSMNDELKQNKIDSSSSSSSSPKLIKDYCIIDENNNDIENMSIDDDCNFESLSSIDVDDDDDEIVSNNDQNNDPNIIIQSTTKNDQIESILVDKNDSNFINTIHTGGDDDYDGEQNETKLPDHSDRRIEYRNIHIEFVKNPKPLYSSKYNGHNGFHPEYREYHEKFGHQFRFDPRMSYFHLSQYFNRHQRIFRYKDEGDF
ncbi:hypothetical protein HUG17_10057 [Dermatophagoides farinae]|nr:hypothetical protein HUG17_10057 [Dermatophagoides farinae]